MIFSKSYCPYCDKTKSLLKRGSVTFKCIELDQVSGGAALEKALKNQTNYRTFPNCFVGKKHMGGNSEMQTAAKGGKLKKMLDDLMIRNTF